MPLLHFVTAFYSRSSSAPLAPPPKLPHADRPPFTLPPDQVKTKGGKKAAADEAEAGAEEEVPWLERPQL